MKRAITLKPPKSASAKSGNRDNPPWSEEMLGSPVMRRGRAQKVPTKVPAKKSKAKAHPRGSEKDTMRPEYDFSKAVRGATAARYAEGTNMILLDPDGAELVPDSRAANEALRTIVRMKRPFPRRRPGTRTA